MTKKAMLFHAFMFVVGLYATFFEKHDPHVQYAFLSLALPIISAIAGGFANKSSTSKQDQTSTTTPNLDAGGMDLRNQIVQAYIKQLLGTSDMSGYTASGISNINKNAATKKAQTTENLSARGISGDALAFAQNKVDNQRFSDVTDFQNSIPLLQQQLQSQILSNAGNYLSTNPYGSTTKGAGTTQTPGNVAGGVLGNAASTLAYLYGQGAYSKKG